MRVSKLAIILVFTSIMINCSGQNNKQAYQEIEYHQEFFILFDFLTYYKEDFGNYPSDLTEITKLFQNDTVNYSGINKSNIKANIKDPFSSGYYKYTLINENSFILYSVGEDGNDDNLNVLDEYNKSGKIVFYHYDKDSSAGDILIYHLENGKVINDFTDVIKLE